jgi:hypothetical protein
MTEPGERLGVAAGHTPNPSIEDRHPSGPDPLISQGVPMFGTPFSLSLRMSAHGVSRRLLAQPPQPAYRLSQSSHSSSGRHSR